MEHETDDEFKHRVFSTVTEWVPAATDIDIPLGGVVRSVWKNVQSIRVMTDDELAEEYFNALEDDGMTSTSWWGVVARSWLDLLRMERACRYESRN